MDRRWIVVGAALGAAAGIAFAVFEMVVAAAMGDGFWMPLRMIGAILLGEEALESPYSLTQAALVGGIVHLSLSALYGAVFAGAVRLAPALQDIRPLVVLGAAYGIALWLVNFYVIAPIAFPWFEDADTVVQFLAHTFFFGALLGALIAAFAPRTEPGLRRTPEHA